MIDIQSIKLIDLVPPNLRSDETVKAAAESIDKELMMINEHIPKLVLLYMIDHLDDEWVDELAWEYHVDFYDPTLPIEQKRELVKYAIPWHRRKGTPSAVEELIATVFGSGQVVEWFEYDGRPYRFKVVTSDPAATNERAQEFIKAINSVKNTRSWLDKVEISTSDNMNLRFAGILHVGDNITLRQVI